MTEAETKAAEADAKVTEAEAKERVDGNDRINGALVIGESRANADVLVPAHERTPEE